jgi:sarcosine oxidase delta subunit
VTACDGWMREAAEDGEVASECREFLQIGRERVTRAFVLREKMLRQHPEVVGDEQHALWRRL